MRIEMLSPTRNDSDSHFKLANRLRSGRLTDELRSKSITPIGCGACGSLEAPGHPRANRRHRHNPFASLRADEHAHVGKGGEPLTERYQQTAAAEDGARPVGDRCRKEFVDVWPRHAGRKAGHGERSNAAASPWSEPQLRTAKQIRSAAEVRRRAGLAADLTREVCPLDAGKERESGDWGNADATGKTEPRISDGRASRPIELERLTACGGRAESQQYAAHQDLESSHSR